MSVRSELIKRLKMSHSPSNRNLHQRPDSDFVPESWSIYFDSAFNIQTSRGNFCAYFAGFDNHATIICLHGGGFSSLTWSVFTQHILQKVKVRVIGFDLRGHGNSRVQGDEDLSMDALAEDMTECIEKLFSQETCIPNIILIGHSLGGAIATRLAAPPSRISKLIQALIVIDVVEGSALASLSHMNNVLQSRPKGFATLKDAILWSASKAQTKDFTALRVSVPGQLKQISNNEPATEYVKEEQEMWNNLLTSQANMHSISIAGAEDTAGCRGRQRSAFQPVGSTVPRPSAMVSSQLNIVTPRGPSREVPTCNSGNQQSHSIRNLTENSDYQAGSAIRCVQPTNPNVSGSHREFNRLTDIENRCESRRQAVRDRTVPNLADPQLRVNLVPMPPPSNVFRPISPAPSRTQMSSLPPIPQRNALASLWTGPYAQPGSNPDRYTWRVNLHASSKYWPDWFKGMSEKFLEAPAKKLLILCGEDRLDTALWKGHMQGKFQMTFLKSGHQVQEDKPEELSELVSQFLIRHQLCEGLDRPTPVVSSSQRFLT